MTSVPDILRASVLLYRAHAKLFVGYASWLLLSYAAIVLATLIPSENYRLGIGIALDLVDGVLWLWISVVTTVLAVQLLDKKEPDPNALPWLSLSVLGSFVWISLLQALTIAGGILMFIIPGLIFLVWFGFATQALLLDGKKGLDALSASRDLAKGRFWTAALYQLGGPIVCGAAYLTALAALYLLVSYLSKTPVDIIFGENPPLWAGMLETVGNIFLLPLLSIYGVLAYREMKKERT